MKIIYRFLAIASFAFMAPNITSAQIDEDQLGAWYMYFYDAKFKGGPWGIQGDVQYRNFDLIGDLEQLLIRSGITYTPENVAIKLTLGYGNITTGTFGDSDETSSESRIYQEALFPVVFGKRIFTNHRFRYEQRFVENQDFRTRYRYNLFINVPINKAEFIKNTFYLALYNEVFINGQQDIGDGRFVEIFDRNRLYGAIGYIIKSGMKVQLGIMRQTTGTVGKNQLQLSFHHKI